jgi:FAD/FMN-containing dehydrogenase
VRCASATDVQRAVEFGRNNELLVAVRGGGHSYAGHSTCDGGMVVDLSPMKGVEVDRDQRIAHAEAGLTTGELDAATQAFGLATSMGACSATGISGVTLGGGFAWLASRHGASCDNLLAADIVTAAGEVERVSPSENGDLFWARRASTPHTAVTTRDSSP